MRCKKDPLFLKVVKQICANHPPLRPGWESSATLLTEYQQILVPMSAATMSRTRGKLSISAPYRDNFAVNLDILHNLRVYLRHIGAPAPLLSYIATTPNFWCWLRTCNQPALVREEGREYYTCDQLRCPADSCSALPPERIKLALLLLDYDYMSNYYTLPVTFAQKIEAEATLKRSVELTVYMRLVLELLAGVGISVVSVGSEETAEDSDLFVLFLESLLTVQLSDPTRFTDIVYAGR